MVGAKKSDDADASSSSSPPFHRLLRTLSRPEDMLGTLLLPPTPSSSAGGRDDEVEMLRKTSTYLFRRLEVLAGLEEKLKKASREGGGGDGEEGDAGAEEGDGMGEYDAPLSGLTELYTGDDGDDADENRVGEGGERQEACTAAADAETIWGQVDLQNEVLIPRLRRSLRSLAKSVARDSGGDAVRLVDLGGLSDKEEEDGPSCGGDGSASNSGSESDGGNDSGYDFVGEEDSEARRIRERMERAMADLEEDDEGDGDDDKETTEAGAVGKMGGQNDAVPTEENEEGEEDLVDPAADELNDGFFDINDMEAFADEEEEYLPDEAYPEERPEKKGKKAKLPHRRQREGEDDDSSDDEHGGEEEELPPVRRKKYRDDEEIDALYKLYEEADSENYEEDDDVVNMTAVDFFGGPNKRYLRAKRGESVSNEKADKKKTLSQTRAVNEDEVDSWDEHSFGDDDGPDWRDRHSEEGGSVEGDNDKYVDNDERETDEEAAEDDARRGKKERLSTHASRSEKLKKQTELLEKEALAEKPWQMTGEAKGTERPTDSLLQATPEFEVATKMAPIITVEHTVSIEDMIKKRIVDEDWDDVVPRELPDIGANKRKGELPEVSQEKSKLGLGELYEREYLKKVAGYDVDAMERQTEEDKAKNEMKALFANLCSKLDALSNYHFAPRPVADEAEVRPVTTPAIAMEEVLPLHVSDARGVAPEEVYAPATGRRSVIRGESEMDQTERKRLRNAKKAARRKARKAKLADEKLISRLQPGLGLNNPYEKRKLREELSMARASGKVTAGDIDANKDYNTSSKFFQRMQESVEQTVRDGGASKGKRKRKRNNIDEGRKSSALKL